VGYSPERVNPGDKEHSLVKIIKIVSGDDDETLDAIAALYGSIIEAGVHRVSSIKVAEAAKVLENTQRDLNIALMNEWAIISNLVGIDTREVIDAAATKWNFFRLSPGLVGGHCIGVVPYYLSYKAEQLGYHPDVILAGRRINNEMGRYIGQQIIKQMIAAGINIKGARVNIFGLSFKPNIQDLSNSKIVDTIKELESFGVSVFVCDPIAKRDDAMHRYEIALTDFESLPVADAVVLAVAHEIFIQQGLSLMTSKLHAGGCFIDIPSFYPAKEVLKLGFSVWRL
jgi:UDP-N-acetyl-D-galactosamine dehydrogenase